MNKLHERGEDGIKRECNRKNGSEYSHVEIGCDNKYKHKYLCKYKH